MITILGKVYMTDKEASQRYGYSKSWFQRQRHDRKEPHYAKMNGKILYELESTDRYFENLLQVIY